MSINSVSHTKYKSMPVTDPREGPVVWIELPFSLEYLFNFVQHALVPGTPSCTVLVSSAALSPDIN